MLIYDSLSHFPIADDQVDILGFEAPSHEALTTALSHMILSSSGWRKVFAESQNEEDRTPSVDEADAALTALAALALCRFLSVDKASKEAVSGKNVQQNSTRKTVLLGLDARPTGRVLGDIVARTLTALDVDVRYLFITTAPQIMADCNLQPEEADAFFYISASHNPVGHNGFKFGKDGGVFSTDQANVLSDIFLQIVKDEPHAFAYLQQCSKSMDTERYRAVLSSVARQQQQSLDRYESFVLTTATKSSDIAVHRTFKEELKKAHQKLPLGVLGELNGSARSTTIDKRLLTSLGVTVHLMNDTPGQIVHAIVPEGENLELCRQSLQQLYEKDSSYRIGYVPDNDGDRGNIVYINEQTKKASILDAQSVFALVVLSELSQTRLQNPNSLLAVVVNGPTSMRIQTIAQAFDAELFRTEVGEANVVQLAQIKRNEGYLVPVLGEGSNGGNITHPAKVRDPLNTLMSLIKLLRNRDIAKLWYRANGKEVPHIISFEKIIESLPAYTTTGAFCLEGITRIHQTHQILKNRYEVIFRSEWTLKEQELKQMGIVSYSVLQTEGIVEQEGAGESHRSEPYSGGYKVVLKDEEGIITDYLWMRGSKTEPVFRVLVDCKGDDQKRHDYLLNWHRSMIAKADSD